MLQPDMPEERRYRCAVPVTLRRRGTDLALLTSEVSFRDAFVRTTDAPPANSLVRLVFTLPPDEAKITLSAHVTRVIGAEAVQDHYPGFLARFVGLDGPVKARWEALVQELRREHAESEDTTVVFAPLEYVAGFQRKAPAAGDLWLRPATVEELESLVRGDIPGGAVFVPSASVTPGTNVTVQLVHPVTESAFPLEGVVKRSGAGAQAGGVTVGLAALTEQARVELQEMADSVVVLDDYDIELFEEPSVSQR